MGAERKDKRPRKPRAARAVAPDTEAMSSVDLAWLEMDRADNPMVVAAILELDQVRSVKALVDTIATRLQRHARFRQHADDDCRPALWVGEAQLDRSYHFHLRRLPGPDPAVLLRQAIAHELASPLDHAHPLWRLSFFTGLRGRVTLLFRAHHAMADGVSLLRLLLKLADGVDAAVPPAPQQHPLPVETHRGPLASAIHGLEALDQAWLGLQAFARRSLEQPGQSLATIARAVGGAAVTARVLSLRNRNPARFRAALTGVRRVDWSAPAALQPLRLAARRHGATLNDLFLATLAGAFGRYLRASEPVARNQSLRISIPVDLRPPGDEAFGNCFGLLLFELPVGEQDARRRLKLVARRMARLKRSPEARAMLLALGAAGYLPVFLEKLLVGMVAGKAAAVVSNLRGPEETLHFAGARLRNAVFWPPQTGGVGIGVSLLSYAGEITLGLCCDCGVLPDPHCVIEAYDAELRELLQPA